MIGKKSWKKISKDEKNEEENLGVREPVRLAPKKVYQRVSKFKIYRGNRDKSARTNSLQFLGP